MPGTVIEIIYVQPSTVDTFMLGNISNATIKASLLNKEVVLYKKLLCNYSESEEAEKKNAMEVTKKNCTVLANNNEVSFKIYENDEKLPTNQNHNLDLNNDKNNKVHLYGQDLKIVIENECYFIEKNNTNRCDKITIKFEFDKKLTITEIFNLFTELAKLGEKNGEDLAKFKKYVLFENFLYKTQNNVLEDKNEKTKNKHVYAFLNEFIKIHNENFSNESEESTHNQLESKTEKIEKNDTNTTNENILKKNSNQTNVLFLENYLKTLATFTFYLIAIIESINQKVNFNLDSSFDKQQKNDLSNIFDTLQNAITNIHAKNLSFSEHYADKDMFVAYFKDFLSEIQNEIINILTNNENKLLEKVNVSDNKPIVFIGILVTVAFVLADILLGCGVIFDKFNKLDIFTKYFVLFLNAIAAIIGLVVSWKNRVPETAKKALMNEFGLEEVEPGKNIDIAPPIIRIQEQ